MFVVVVFKSHEGEKTKVSLILEYAGIRQQLLFLEEIIMLETCFPFPGFDIDDYSPVFLSQVLQDDHIMWFIGIIHINTAGPHTENLEIEKEKQKTQLKQHIETGRSTYTQAESSFCLCS